MTDDPLVSDLTSKSGSPLLNFFEAVLFVLSTVGICTPNVEPIQQQLSDAHLIWK